LQDLEVIDNPFWSIKGGKTVDLVTLMYYNMPKKFSEHMPEDIVPPPAGKPKTDEHGQFTNEEFKFIPERKVDGDGANQMYYSHEQV
jgi:hypothetical protein